MNPQYEEDFHAWLESQIQLIKNKEFEKLDTEHLLEEMETLGNSEKYALESFLMRTMQHMLKWQYQPGKRTNSWKKSIEHHRNKANKVLNENPGIKQFLNNIFLEAYEDARLEASDETGIELDLFPEKSPWSIDEVLGE